MRIGILILILYGFIGGIEWEREIYLLDFVSFQIESSDETIGIAVKDLALIGTQSSTVNVDIRGILQVLPLLSQIHQVYVPFLVAKIQPVRLDIEFLKLHAFQNIYIVFFRKI